MYVLFTGRGAYSGEGGGGARGGGLLLPAVHGC